MLHVACPSPYITSIPMLISGDKFNGKLRCGSGATFACASCRIVNEKQCHRELFSTLNMRTALTSNVLVTFVFYFLVSSGKTTCTIITLAPYEWFEEWEDERVMKRGQEYEEIKNRLGKRAWEQTCKLFPQVRDKLDFFDVGSPLSNKYENFN